jgi:hypothetical protein
MLNTSQISNQFWVSNGEVVLYIGNHDLGVLWVQNKVLSGLHGLGPANKSFQREAGRLNRWCRRSYRWLTSGAVAL